MKREISKNFIKGVGLALMSLFLGAGSLFAQVLTPPPGPLPPGPNPIGTPPPPGPGQIPPTGQGPTSPPPPPGWGSPGCLVTPPTADWMNQGYMNVMATGYDTESVLVQIPLYISYNFNGVNYNVTVINSWSPLTQTWNLNVDTPANQTDYYFNGFTYNYYVVLPSGTFYFNL